MREFVTYIANDGKKFYNKEDAIQYEKDHNIENVDNEILAWNAQNEKMEFDGILRSISDVYKVRFLTSHAHATFVRLCDHENCPSDGLGFDIGYEPGTYEWDWDEGWVKVEE